MRQRTMGVLLLMSGVSFIAGVVNPPLLPTWGAPVREAIGVASAHRVAWLTSTWLITLAIVAAVAAVELLARVVECDAARLGRSLYLVGAALALASTSFDLAVTSTLLDARELPDWYLGTQQWAAGLSTAYFALLAPAALAAFGVAVLRTRMLPAWNAWVLLVAAALLLGQYAAFRDALPAPQFLAFIAVGGAAAIRGPRSASRRPSVQ
ncbi:hypothetical protein Daura_28880 [Dactylosporangium aurantiacum]|uniref:Uncharacterized protein n=1 Tax=Dactylosporangium aurantiacum TaxID=35754 RepID=A0A9Q9ICB4_9ACTN|nr:hypothetical protein [Dactylosporangium aurantiacum]MDG6106668.1 hypothetical protein [Dactylosporangium aurantiacum]UWZ50824.1 hypothetical protein Daura_28880 [Dactylosporangium aurantiacum]